MTKSARTAPDFRFETFEVDLQAGELRKAGAKLKLSGQPFQVLTILLERPGEVVTREELQKRLWPDTFVDVDHNLNTAINKIREVLGDSAESPRYVETLPRRGYRFIAPVDNGVAQPEPIPELAPPSKPKTWRKPWFYGAALGGLLIVTVGAAILWKAVSPSPRAPKVLRYTKLTNDGHAKFGPMATDGSRLFFNEVLADGRSIVAQVSVKGREAIPLSLPLKTPSLLDISKDGSELLVSNDEGNGSASLWEQPVAGGSPHRVGTLFEQVNGEFAAFGADGTGIIYSQGHDVYLMNRDGSSPRKLLTVENLPHWFRFSPDARTLRFAQSDPNGPMNTLMSAKADGTGLHKMFRGCCGDWTPDGRFFVFLRTVDDHINFWTLRESKGFSWHKDTDEPAQLTAGPFDFEYPLPGKDGKEIFAVGDSPRAEVIRYDARIHEFVPYLSGVSAEGLAFSPDGQWVAYVAIPEGTLWRSKTDGSERLQLTLPNMQVSLPRWSPDGKQIAFSAARPRDPMNIYVISSAGGTAERIVASDQGQLDVGWSPDGKSLVFGSAPGSFDQNASISVIDLKSRRLSIVPGSKGLFSPHWSPDGRYMSGTTKSTNNLMLYDFSTQKWTKLTESVVGYPNWSRDGSYLYFWNIPSPDAPWRIARVRMSDRKIETVAAMGNIGRLYGGLFDNWLGLAPDNSPLLARDVGTQEIYALEMDWP